jgi:hypothetical protein
MRPECRPPPAARAASCSKASSHCPGKGRNGSVRDGFPSSPRKRGPRAGRWIPACAGMNGVLCAGDEPHRAHCSACRNHDNFTTARRSSTKGKPPGGDPAAPVRRRSCRGAGSATAGARLGYMVTTGVVRQCDPCPTCPCRSGADPNCGASRRHHVRGTRGPPRPSD